MKIWNSFLLHISILIDLFPLHNTTHGVQVLTSESYLKEKNSVSHIKHKVSSPEMIKLKTHYL